MVDAPTWAGTVNAVMSLALLKAGSTTQVTVLGLGGTILGSYGVGYRTREVRCCSR